MSVDIFGSSAAGVPISPGTDGGVENGSNKRFAAIIANLAIKVNKTDLALKASAADLTSRASLINLATKISKTGDIINGDLFIKFDDDTTRSFGINNIGEGKFSILLLGSLTNSILCAHNSPLLIITEKGTKFNCAHGDVCLFGNAENAKAQFY